MAGVAVAMICLLGVAIYSLSRLQTAPWTSSLTTPDIQSTLRKNLPQFELRDGEKSLTPQQFEGKWTLLSFWSYSCPPCLEELPALNQLGNNWQGPELQIIAVNTDPSGSENLELAKRFLTEQEITLLTYFDSKGALTGPFEIQEIPRHFLVNPNKQIVWDAKGAFKWNEASARDQLLRAIEPQAPESAQDPGE
jgi:thiol-disulfide isomerase/thioredoxin